MTLRPNRSSRLRHLIPLLAGALLSLDACSRGMTGPSGTTDRPGTGGPLVFRASPLDESEIRFIVALGNLNPPGHTFPSDHIYFYNRVPPAPPTTPAAVYAPGDGTVQFLLADGAETQVGVRSGSFTYYMAHIVLDPAIRVGSAVTAGQRIGTTGSSAYAIDLGVINEQKTTAFINPLRYPSTSRHGDAPLPYFEEPLRSRLYRLVQRVGADLDGRFDFDVAGRLVGNWFLEGVPVSDSASASAWPRHLAFVYDSYDPTRIRVSVGGTLPIVGAFAVQAGATDPRDVTPASGTVVYRLLSAGGAGDPPGPQRGILAVQMIDANTIRVDALPDGTATDLVLSGTARTYVR